MIELENKKNSFKTISQDELNILLFNLRLNNDLIEKNKFEFNEEKFNAILACQV